MNPWIGWALALALLVAGWQAYGAPGVLMAITATVFWLLLQFNRAVRVLRSAAAAPVGQVPNAVSFHAGLRRGMTMAQVVGRTRSLGRRLDAQGERWAWADAAGDAVELQFSRGRLAAHRLQRASRSSEVSVPGP